MGMMYLLNEKCTKSLQGIWKADYFFPFQRVSILRIPMSGWLALQCM